MNIESHLRDGLSFQISLIMYICICPIYPQIFFSLFFSSSVLVDGFFISLKYDFCFITALIQFICCTFSLLYSNLVPFSQTMNYFISRICDGISHSSFCSNWAAHNFRCKRSRHDNCLLWEVHKGDIEGTLMGNTYDQYSKPDHVCMSLFGSLTVVGDPSSSSSSSLDDRRFSSLPNRGHTARNLNDSEHRLVWVQETAT